MVYCLLLIAICISVEVALPSEAAKEEVAPLVVDVEEDSLEQSNVTAPNIANPESVVVSPNANVTSHPFWADLLHLVGFGASLQCRSQIYICSISMRVRPFGFLSTILVLYCLLPTAYLLMSMPWLGRGSGPRQLPRAGGCAACSQ